MYRRIVEYKDFDGNPRKEECLFHLTKADITKMLLVDKDLTLDKILFRIAKERDRKKAGEFFDELIKKSYGKKSEDGRRFMRNEEILEDFLSTEAYSIIYTEIISDAEKAAEFVNGIIPDELKTGIADVMKDNNAGIPDELKDFLTEQEAAEIEEMNKNQPPISPGM